MTEKLRKICFAVDRHYIQTGLEPVRTPGPSLVTRRVPRTPQMFESRASMGGGCRQNNIGTTTRRLTDSISSDGIPQPTTTSTAGIVRLRPVTLVVAIMTLMGITRTLGVDQSKFMRCDQSPACRRYTRFVEHQSELAKEGQAAIFEVVPESLALVSSNSHATVFNLKNTIDDSELSFTIRVTSAGIFRFTADEISPLYPRYRFRRNDVFDDDTLDKLYATAAQGVSARSDDSSFTISVPVGGSSTAIVGKTNTAEIRVQFKPFRISMSVDGRLKQTINSKDLMNFERYRNKPPGLAPAAQPCQHRGEETGEEPLPQGEEISAPHANEEWDEAGHRIVHESGTSNEAALAASSGPPPGDYTGEGRDHVESIDEGIVAEWDEAGADESGADLSGADESGADESGADLSGTDESGADEIGTNEVGTNEVGTDEVGTNEVGTIEVGTNEVGTNEVGTNEVGTNEVGTNEVGTNEVGTNEVGTNEVGTDDEADDDDDDDDSIDFAPVEGTTGAPKAALGNDVAPVCVEPYVKVVEGPVPDAVALDPSGAWSSVFAQNTDFKRKGPCAVGIDVELHDVSRTFGLPEHATVLTLPAYDKPYRSYNLDVFEYDLDSPMALYGTVPLLLSQHRPRENAAVPTYSGFLWTNPSETWLKLDSGRKMSAGDGRPGKILDLQQSGASTIVEPSQSPCPREDSVLEKTSLWVASETGVLDFLIFAGPSPQDVLAQYHLATGQPAVAPLFSIGKHQCRWNYNSEQDVSEVDAGFDQHEIPYDVIWLDIEHTNGKRYFTWDPASFPTPSKMLANLSQKKRKLVAIVDPHIKKDPNYPIYNKLLAAGALLYNPDQPEGEGRANRGTVFDGWCWPGSSVYPDFLDPRVRELFASFYLPSTWNGSCDDLMVWNDMNEPSVFNHPEDGFEHREVHNLYGMLYHRTTYEGLLARNKDQRPFVLSRSFFIGSHRYGAIWTGDNAARWDHLKISVPMLLSHCLGGLSFIGADVGGFFGEPGPELYTRWSQLGVWYPFYRDHAHLNSRRREPWLFGEPTLSRVRNAVLMRYRLLPYWYTLFMEFSLLSKPILAPIWWNHSDVESHSFEDRTFWVGESLVVNAVVEPQEALPAGRSPESNRLEIYLPFTDANGQWYRLEDGSYLPLPDGVNVCALDVDLENIPVFVKAGSVLVVKDRIRRSARIQLGDPFTILVYPTISRDGKQSASGRIFLDDGDSYAFRSQGRFIYTFLTWAGDSQMLTLLAKAVDLPPLKAKEQVLVNSDVESVVVYGLLKPPQRVTSGDQSAVFYTDEVPSIYPSGEKRFKVTIKRPNGVKLGEYGWTVTLVY